MSTIKYCKVCNKPIPEGRVKAGYVDTCVNHSKAFKYVGIVSGTEDDNFEISIIKDPDTAKDVSRLLKHSYA